jgi:hypothetical protein
MILISSLLFKEVLTSENQVQCTQQETAHYYQYAENMKVLLRGNQVHNKSQIKSQELYILYNDKDVIKKIGQIGLDVIVL